MGGKAFAYINPDAPINVPRLPPETYKQVAADVRLKLETLFRQVTIPREAPGKTDYGDIDFLVEGIREPNDASNIWPAVKELLGADFQVAHSFALRHPYVSGAYVQVDVELSTNGAGLFEWTKFMKSDSDLVQIIGIIHRSLGLVCNDKGLHVRAEEVEPYDKKKSQVFLTNDPNEAMDFYGYDKAKYYRGFKTETELFDWATNGRFFTWEMYEDRVENSNDRVRKRKRLMYCRFVEEYMPSSGKATFVRNSTSDSASDEACQSVGTRPSRPLVLREALNTFNKEKEYDAVILRFETQGLEDALWKKISASIPPPRGTALQGLKKWVAFKDGRPYICNQPLSKSAKLRWTSHFSKDALPDVLAWVDESREQIRKFEENRVKEARNTGLKK